MVKPLTIILFIFSFHGGIGQSSTSNYNEVDNYAKSIKYEGSLKKLAKSLTNKYTEDKNKARSIYSWIALNIEYDYEGLKDRSILKTDPEGVIENGKSVCQGYANLFKEICKLAELECETISGRGRNSYIDIGKKNLKSNHSWNAVKIEGEWKLIDATWGRISENEVDGVYFFTPPEKMILNHYPEQPKWQLGVEYSKEKLNNSPVYYSHYLTSGINNLNKPEGFLKPNKIGKTKIEFEFKGSVKSIIIKGSSKGRKAKNIKFKHSNDIVSIKFKVQKKSLRYTIYLNNIGILDYKTTTKIYHKN